MSSSFDALRRANPRNAVRFDESVDAAAHTVRARLATMSAPPKPRAPRAAAVALAIAAAVAVAVTIAPRGGGPGIENAAAAIRQATNLTAAAAERSGTASVRITQDGQTWAGTTVQWHGNDLATSRGVDRPRAGSEWLLVGGILYAFVEGGWVDLGSPKSIDPHSGTTPAEYLAAVREDVGGVTLHRVTDAMTGLTTRRLDDGSTVYSGTVASGLIARESGFKEGHAIRVLPFGYVAHDEAADPAAPLDTTVTVGGDGIVREIAVSWGGASRWKYTVTYSGLGTTAAPVAPAHARSLLRERLRAVK
jgi:hypothetical protein